MRKVTRYADNRTAKDDRSDTIARRDARHPTGFKPVALPAVAAAVEAAMLTPQRRPEPRDVPAILRDDADMG
jgi:hypothetical protein